MKRKLITLLVAILALFAIKAQAEIVVVHSGDSLLSRQNYPATFAPTRKVVYEGGKFVYKFAAASTMVKADRLKVLPVDGTNMVSFYNLDETDLLKIKYGTTDYTQFVVIQGFTNTAIYGSGSEKDCGNLWDAIVSQPFLGGNFSGYLAIQVTTGSVDDCDMLIVVSDQTGVFKLIPYGDYIKYLQTNSDAQLRASGTSRIFPLYVQTEQLSGRWATPADFADCKFFQFHSEGDKTSGTVLTAYDATVVEKGTQSQNKGFSTFTVKQVDYVLNNDASSGGAHVTNNIITHTGAGANFQGKDFDLSFPGKGTYYGTYNDGSFAPGTGVIPLFILSTPEDECKVLSVSRINNLLIQSMGDNGFANQLELREYASYYTYDPNAAGTVWTYTQHEALPVAPGLQGNPDDVEYDTYTSLQKFAIWINEDGEMVLYPAASYFWKYGESKTEAVGASFQGIKIVGNAVLKYNNITVSLVTTGDFADKQNGLQIGWWNATVTVDPKAKPGITTMPNLRQTVSDYDLCPFDRVCWEDDKDLSGRFYFLQVNTDTVGVWNNSGLEGGWAFGRPTSTNLGYQWHRDHVLATGLDVAGGGNAKSLNVVPKELNRGDSIYWRFPYDKVNMGAHWEIQRVPATGTLQGYRFINMLGDTLQYENPAGPGIWDQTIVGGYATQNSLWPGSDGSLGYTEGVHFFGSPRDLGQVWSAPPANWFRPVAKTVASRDVWKIHQMKGTDKFVLELAGTGVVAGTTLTPYTSVGYKGWYYNSVNNIQAAKVGLDDYYYFQQRVALDVPDVSLQTYQDGDFDACSGMLIEKKEIDYVPTYGPFYPGEPNDGIINTTAQGGKDVFWKSDSLTAYSFLEGFYDIKEAKNRNDLMLGSETVALNDGLGTKVNVARLKPTQDKLEFIPLNSTEGNLRRTNIQAHQVGAGVLDQLAWLYGETYKWYLVKLGNKYLSFDWVNLAASTNRESMGFVFTDTLENALPVRLYQPLVGDKEESNFLFQFYMPNYYYQPHAAPLNRAIPTNFYEPESLVYGTSRFAPGSFGNEVCFASLSNHSDYIFATRAYNSTTSGTRFTSFQLPSPPCECLGEFIAQSWMGEERLLNLPLNNQIWLGDDPVNAWIATGETVTGGNSAIVTNDGADKATTLLHTYVASIKEYSGLTGLQAKYNQVGVGKVLLPTTSTASADSIWVGGAHSNWTTGFFPDLEVPLYYVQNADGKYLTVVPKCDMRDPYATVEDVNGIKLEWRDKVEYSSTSYTDLGYDLRAFQLFAINGCMDDQPDADGNYGKFVYLPLASYVCDYKTGNITETVPGIKDISYNAHLGKANAVQCPNNDNNNDIRDCYRISQYSRVDNPVKHLVVFNASSAVVGGSVTPIEFKVTKQKFLKPDCESYIVQNIGKGVNSGLFYSVDAQLKAANENTLFAHWTIDYAKTDEYLATFAPEVKKVYNLTVGTDIPQTQLTGKYYFIKKLNGKDDEYQVIDVKGYETFNYTAKFDTLKVTCTEHALPFYDLEADAGYNLFNKLAILEVPYLDRNLTYVVNGDAATPTPIYRGGNLIGYQTYINQIGEGFTGAEYLTVYKENRRELTGPDQHTIPYYSFAATVNGIEYFLNVDVAPAGTTRQDSVYWTALSDADKLKLIDWENNEDFLPTYKFCLPYQMDANGVPKDEVAYSDGKYPPVYLQTLDLGINDYPYLVVAGASTKYVTARKLWDAITAANRTSTLAWNIFTVDYRYIDPMQVTAWLFGGQIPGSNIWVPIAEAITDGSTEGVLTNYGLGNGGVTFIDQRNNPSNLFPRNPNYGILTGINDAPTLTVEFEGDTLIGAHAKRPIWYYRIKLDGKYLTDATGKTSDYYLQFGTEKFPYGFFGDKIDNFKDYVDEGITADEDFVQAFGFKYVDGAKDPFTFYIVSNADYSIKPTREDKFRFLADINNQLVFVDDPKDALIFQWGHIENGDYTDLKVVGKAGIYGVEGGIKFLNTTGKVDIYSIDGRLIKSAVLTGGEQIIAVPRGIALVKGGAVPVKVVVQ